MYSNIYIKQLEKLHADTSRPQGFGGKVKKLGRFYEYMKLWNPNSLLDYGCGKGYILEHLKEQYPSILCEGYDPAVLLYNTQPNKAYECVFSNDVLEHIEPLYINAVLAHINTLSSKYTWLRIDTMPARKLLPDGRNAHLIQEDKTWWTNKINNFIDGNLVYTNLDNKGKLDIAIEK